MSAPIVLEETYWDAGRDVIGCDEVGRGCLAGPVVCCAVSFHRNRPLEANDSKKVSPVNRRLYCTNIEMRSRYHVASRSARQVDDMNVLAASLDGMKEAVVALVAAHGLENPIVLVDGNREIPDLPFEQKCLTKGDSKSRSIAAASIVAKVYRDDFMVLLDRITGTKYSLCSHKGYPSKAHYEALEVHGPSGFHRRSFRLSGGYKKQNNK